MTFAEAMDAIGVSAPDLSETLGLAPQTIRQMRMDPDNPNYREPPKAWRTILAAYARSRCAHLNAIAEELERDVE